MASSFMHSYQQSSVKKQICQLGRAGYCSTFSTQPLRYDWLNTSQLHLSRLNVPSWQAKGEWPPQWGFTQSHVIQMPGCPVAGSAALFWISAFIGSKHWQRYPPPHQPSSSAQTQGMWSAEGSEKSEWGRERDRGERGSGWRMLERGMV